LVIMLVLALGLVGAGLYSPGYAGALLANVDTAWHPGRPAPPAPTVLTAAGADDAQAPVPTPEGFR